MLKLLCYRGSFCYHVFMIISLFGPDGVGKSTISKEFDQLGWVVFSGTNVASWPDQSWHRALIEQGIDESTLDEESHFIEKIKRVYRLARSLEATNQVVVIDSDPFHKTITHDYLRSMPDITKGKGLMRKRYAHLKRLVDYDELETVQVCFQISAKLPDEQQAAICMDRLAGRTTLAYFDPKDITQSLDRVRATQELKRIISEEHDTLITINTDTSFNLSAFLTELDKLKSR